MCKFNTSTTAKESTSTSTTVSTIHHSTASRSGDGTGKNWTSYTIHPALRALSECANVQFTDRTHFQQGRAYYEAVESEIEDVG